jgi:hypothetical protein
MKGMDSGGSGAGVHAGPHPKGTVIGHGSSGGDSGQSSGGSASVSPTPRGHMNPHELLDPLIVDTHHGMNSPGLSSSGKHDSGYITRMNGHQRISFLGQSIYSLDGKF